MDTSAAALLSALQDRASRLGLALLGVTLAEPAPHLAAYEQWLAAGLHADMRYLARPDRLARRRDLSVILPGVQRIISVALSYYTVDPPAALVNDPSRGRISNYAWGADYHDLFTAKLKGLGEFLAEQAGAHYEVYVDTGAILERDHAWAAGLGFIGKNNCLIHPHTGSYLFLGELLVDIPLPVTTETPLPNRCGVCHRCLDACPTGALIDAYQLDSRRCISYLTIENKGPIPRSLRPLLGNWIYGCDICQQVCPWQRFRQPTAELAFYPADTTRLAPSLLDLIQLDEADFRHRFQRSPIYRLKRARFLRNVAVAIGNWGNPAAVPLLLPRLQDEAPLIRGHVAWALGRIGGAIVQYALRKQAVRETDRWVKEEIDAALADLGRGQ